jgi:hypothetical protein
MDFRARKATPLEANQVKPDQPRAEP